MNLGIAEPLSVYNFDWRLTGDFQDYILTKRILVRGVFYKSMEEAIRIFIAIKLSSQMENRLTLVRQQLMMRDIKDIRWVKRENIHLTIRFLGDIPTGKVGDIITVLDEAAKRSSPFVLRIGGIGAFPNKRTPRVVWVGVDTPLELIDLHRNIERGLDKIGFQSDEKGLKPHLTIGRVKREASRQSLEMLVNNEFPTVGEQMVESIHLIESELRPEGAIYSTLVTVNLGEGTGVE